MKLNATGGLLSKLPGKNSDVWKENMNPLFKRVDISVKVVAADETYTDAVSTQDMKKL